MKVFISWSGQQSHEVAEILKEWLPAVIQAAKPYLSPIDIEKGSRWSNEISKELDHSKVGIICLTRWNLTAPWIMFEAGALAKSMDKTRVFPLLFGVDPSAMSGPLTQFQAASFCKEETRNLVRAINGSQTDSALDALVLDAVFEKWWPELEEKVAGALSQWPTDEGAPNRSERDLLGEILEIVRSRAYGGDRIDPTLLRPIEDLGLSEGTASALKEHDIHYIGDLASLTAVDLLKLPGIGKRTMIEARDKLAAKGLVLGDPVAGWPPRW